MCGGGSAPQPSDATQTADKQMEYNLKAYGQTMAGNAMNQSTPYGNLSYTSFIDPVTGQTRYSATQTLSPENQALLNNMYGVKGQAGQGAGNVLQGAYTGSPDIVGTSNSLTNQMLGNQLNFLNPFFTQQTNQLDNQLRNQGLMPGSEAYNNAMNTLRQNQGQTVSGAVAQFQPQAFQEAMQSYQMPAQLATTLANLGGPFGMSLVNTPTGQMAASNYEGDVQAADQMKMQAYQADLQQKQAMLNGVMSAVGSVGGAMMMSDRRQKTDIHKVGELHDGTPVYVFRYKSGGPVQIGLMAQDVEEKTPEAVIEINGVKHVDYAKATENSRYAA